MRRVDLRRSFAAALALAAGTVFAAAAGDDPRHGADISVTQRAAFVVLPLDVATYARSEADGLADLRVVDARGERVPFALLPPAPPAASETEREVPLYTLPPRKPGQSAWPAPLELRVQQGTVTLIQRPAASAPSLIARPGGWLFDLGEAPEQRAQARRLELRWRDDPAGADFSTTYRLETSADLQRWSSAAGGALLRLGSGSTMLTQRHVALPAAPPRFVRLVWDDAANAPALGGARLVLAPPATPAADAPTRLVLRALAEISATDSLDGRALVFDLGATLPIAQIDLDLGAGTRIAPVVLQVRSRTDAAWRDVGRHAFWQLERDGRTARSEPLALDTRARYLRVVGDQRAARLDAATTQLVVQAPLAQLVIAMQGEPPLKLLAGDAKAGISGALPVAALVPDLAAERARFGRASLGLWAEVPEAAERARSAARREALRPWLLWGVLLVGVALLGSMAWRLARSAR